MRKVMTFLKETAIVVKEQPGVCFAILMLGFAWELCIAGWGCKGYAVSAICCKGYSAFCYRGNKKIKLLLVCS